MEQEYAFALVNDAIRKLAPADGSDPLTWEFFCECPDIACHGIVRLTVADFDARRAATPQLPIRAAEHAAGAA